MLVFGHPTILRCFIPIPSRLQHSFLLEERDDLHTELGKIYRVLDGKRLKHIQPIDQRYPIPYSEEFYVDLLEYESRLSDQDFAHYLTDTKSR
ncbi:MAG: hypothetical protein ACKPCM_19270 [Pseudanabaena sp.]